MRELSQPSGRVETWHFHAPALGTKTDVEAASWFEARAKAMAKLGVGPSELEQSCGSESVLGDSRLDVCRMPKGHKGPHVFDWKRLPPLAVVAVRSK